MWKCQEKVKTKSPSGDMRIKGTKQSCGGGGGALTDCDHSSQHCLTFGFQSSVPPLPGSTTEVGCADLAPGATGAWHGSGINRAAGLGVLSVGKLSQNKNEGKTGDTYSSHLQFTLTIIFHFRLSSFPPCSVWLLLPPPLM